MRRYLPLTLSLLLFPALSLAQSLPAPAPSPAVAPTPAATITPETVQQMADRVFKETSTIRQLSIKRHVPTDVKTAAQIEQYMGGQIDKQAKTGELTAANLYLRQLGLAPKTFDLRTAYARLLGEQVAGFYSSQTKMFTTSSRVNPLELETVMAHELTHALQDQHFDLSRMDKSPRHESDAGIAMTSLVEGDATLVMSRYMTANPLRAFGMLASSLGSLMGNGSDTTQLRQTPRILSQTLEFPYVAGLKFATNLQTRGGWAAVSRAYSRPPKSTQQILHFDKYLSNKLPVKVPVPDVSRVLGTGWKLLDHDVNGEMGLSLVLGQFVDKEQADAVAAGWAGDRYAVYSGPKGAVLVVQDSLWNDTASATRWNATYALRTEIRFAGRASSRAENFTSGAVSIWNAAPDAVWVQQNGRRVLMLEGTAGAFNAQRVFAALKR